MDASEVLSKNSPLKKVGQLTVYTSCTCPARDVLNAVQKYWCES